jgi:hypothetical protein
MTIPALPEGTSLGVVGEVPVAATLQVLDERTRAMAEILEPLRPLLALADQAPALAAMLGDTMDDVVRAAMNNGIDVERGLVNGVGAALRFGAAMDAGKVRELESLLQSGVLDPAAVTVVGEIGQALTDAAARPSSEIGVVGLLKAMRDPDVRRALGLLVTFAKLLGARLA